MADSIEATLQEALECFYAGDHALAAILFRQILDRDPDHAEALHLLGLAEQGMGETGAALLHIAKAVGSSPRDVLYRMNLGTILFEAGRPSDAVSILRGAVECDPNLWEAHYALGNALVASGDDHAALKSFFRSVTLNPGHAETFNNIGLILREQDKLEEAVVYLEKAVQIPTPFPPAFSNLCAAYVELGRLEEALAAGHEAISLAPSDASAHYNLANAMVAADNPEGSLSGYQEAVSLDHCYTDAWINLGAALLACDEPGEAIVALDRAVCLDKYSADANWNRALALLKHGRLTEGWPGYEWRWEAVPWLNRWQLEVPQWRGEEVDGKVILVHAEQGYGDTIQFVRYLPDILRRGGKVRLVCQPALKRLLSFLPDLESVTAHGEIPGPFDLHLPIMSLPEAVGLANPASGSDKIPYISTEIVAPPELTSVPLPKVGLVWRGSQINTEGKFRSCRLCDLGPILLVPHARYFALQPDIEEEERSLLFHLGGADLSSHIQDFGDSAAITDAMDLVISVDTAQAHLTGALGKPIWTLLARGADWRWFLDRDDSPWYPTMRLFRQLERGNWQQPIAQAALALPKFLLGIANQAK